MTYTQAQKALEEIRELLTKDGHFKMSYTTVYAAILNKVAAIASSEGKKNAKT